MKKPLKACLVLVLCLVGLLVLAVVLHPFYLGPSIKAAVEKIGPRVTQTRISLARAHVNLFRGVVELDGLQVDNPAGYTTEAVVKVGAVKIRLAPGSVFTDTIHVKQVYVSGAEAWYEMGIPSSNVGKLQKQVAEFGGDQEKKAAQPQASGKPGKKVVIDDLQILGTRVHVGVRGAGGTALPIPVPNIRKQDLGKEGDGKSIGQMSAEILTSILGGISDAALSAGKAVGDAGKAVGGAVGDAGKAVGGAVGEAGKSLGSGVKSLFGGKE
jgi:hypothetical protein